VNVRKQGSCT